MNFKLFLVILTAACTVNYIWMGYNGEQVSAYITAIWVFAVFLRDLHDYIEDKMFE
jgi:hypothetical protein